jgi:type II secretory pathway component PulK
LALAAVLGAAGTLLWVQARALERARSAAAMLETETLRAAAAEAAREAMATLAADGDLACDHAGEDWAQPMERTREDGIRIAARVEDAGRWVDWNNAGADGTGGKRWAEVLENLLVCCGHFEKGEWSAALQDYLDGDGEGRWEDEFYGKKDTPHGAANRLLWVPEELWHVEGITPDWWRPRGSAERRAAGVFGGEIRESTVVVPPDAHAGGEATAVNVNTAGRSVLLAVAGVENEELVDRALAMRRTRPFASTALLALAGPDASAALSGTLDVKSRQFRVRARAERGNRSWLVTAWVAREENGDLAISMWAEGEGQPGTRP